MERAAPTQHVVKVVNMMRFYQWLEKAGLKESTEALIMAEQEQYKVGSATLQRT